jgi:hypothetical protein
VLKTCGKLVGVAASRWDLSSSANDVTPSNPRHQITSSSSSSSIRTMPASAAAAGAQHCKRPMPTRAGVNPRQTPHHRGCVAIRKLKHAEAPWLINNYGEVFNQNDEDVRLTFDLTKPLSPPRTRRHVRRFTSYWYEHPSMVRNNV